jgi:hypothetical protein
MVVGVKEKGGTVGKEKTESGRSSGADVAEKMKLKPDSIRTWMPSWRHDGATRDSVSRATESVNGIRAMMMDSVMMTARTVHGKRVKARVRMGENGQWEKVSQKDKRPQYYILDGSRYIPATAGDWEDRKKVVKVGGKTEVSSVPYGKAEKDYRRTYGQDIPRVNFLI